MKIFTVIGVVLLVACHQINALPNTNISKAGSFKLDVANITNSILSSRENPTNSFTLFSKIAAFYKVNDERYHFVHHFHRIIFQLRTLAFNMPTSEQILKSITKWQDKFILDFEEMNIERDFNVTDKPSELNELIDEFISRNTQTLVELFDNAYTQAKNLELESEKLAANSIALMDDMIEKVDNCLQIAPTEFKDIFQCHEETRALLPGLAENTKKMAAIAYDLMNILRLKLDGSTSLDELSYNVFVEKGKLYEKKWAEEEKRKQAEMQQEQTEASEDSSE